jgi:nucleotide sugar dehydrogenase
MPGRLVERVRASDKLVSGLLPITTKLIHSVYSRIVTAGTLLECNSLTAEIVKTTENAYRDVRIAYAAEIARFCDSANINFFELRDAVNQNLQQSDSASCDSNAVPSGGLLVPTVGVGGHCLPKDGILLRWRQLEHGERSTISLIEQARRINDASPEWTIRLTEARTGALADRNVAILGAAYRFNSEDTRNSPSLTLARELMARGANVVLHDPYVKADDQNLAKFNLNGLFTNDLSAALASAEILIAATAHHDYVRGRENIVGLSPQLRLVVDACNLWSRGDFLPPIEYAGIGRGTNTPSRELVEFVTRGFRILEQGFTRELIDIIDFLNCHYASDHFNRVDYRQVQRLARTCSTGCRLVDPLATEELDPYQGFLPTLVEFARPRMLSAQA